MKSASISFSYSCLHQRCFFRFSVYFKLYFAWSVFPR